MRLSLNIVNLSDIYSADGQTMDDYYYKVMQSKKHRNIYDWPIKYHINKADYTVRRKLLECIFQHNNRHLPTPLGQWTDMQRTDWINNWDYFVSSDR